MIKGYFIFGYDESVIRKYLQEPNYVFILTREPLDLTQLPDSFLKYDKFRLFNHISGDRNKLFQKFFERFYDLMIIEDFEFIFLDKDVEFHNLWFEILSDCMRHFTIRMQTDYIIGENFVKNLFQNIPFYDNSHGINVFKGAFEGHPVILCGAGPSLSANLNWIKFFSTHSYIIAVSRTIKPLLDSGICPDVNVIADHSPLSDVFVQGLESSSKIPLITEAMASPGVIRDYPGPLFFIKDYGSRFLYSKDEDSYAWIPSGGTVTSLALSFAYYARANPIILVGCDLSYPEWNDKAESYHFTYKENELEKIKKMVEEDKYVWIENNLGGKNLTDSRMYTYSKDFGYLIHSNQDTLVYNVSLNGAKIEGAVVCPFDKITVDMDFKKDFKLEDRFLNKKTPSKISYAHGLKKLKEMKSDARENLKFLLFSYKELKKGMEVDAFSFIESMDVFIAKFHDVFSLLSKQSTNILIQIERFHLDSRSMPDKCVLDWVGTFYQECIERVEKLTSMVTCNT